tara:strand:- start:105 stop:470 length:366 start_codon:yes stop_codon:yes gene_type:complete
MVELQELHLHLIMVVEVVVEHQRPDNLLLMQHQDQTQQMVVLEQLQILQTHLLQEAVVVAVEHIIQALPVFLTDQEEPMLLVVELVDTITQQDLQQQLREQLIQVVAVEEPLLDIQVLQEV